MRTTYPFTAIVGQERMKRALILNAINPQIGGVLIRGERDSRDISFTIPDGQGEVWIKWDQG